MCCSLDVLIEGLETTLRSERPVLAIQDVDGDGDPEFLIGVRELHALTLRGQKKWTFQISGDLHAIAAGHRRDGSSVIAIGTGRVFEFVCSPSNAISILRCEGFADLISPQGNSLLTIRHDKMITALALLERHDIGGTSALLGTGDIGPHTPSEVILVNEQGHVDWRSPTNGVVRVLRAHSFDGQQYIFAGTAEGELIALSSSGRVMWQRQVAATQLIDIRIVSSPKHESCVLAVARDGIMAGFSKHGELVWKDEDRSRTPVMDVCCLDINGDGEDEVLVGRDDTIHCYNSSGISIWTVSLRDHVTCFDTLEKSGASAPRILACIHSTGIILDATDGSEISRFQLYGTGLTCRSFTSSRGCGWLACRARSAKAFLWKLLGQQDIDVLLIPG